MALNKEQDREMFLAWEHHPVTLALKELLLREAQVQQDRWANGAFLGKPMEDAAIIGSVRTYKAVAGIEFEELCNDE